MRNIECLKEEDLAKIEEMANQLMAIPDIAILMDLDDDELTLAIRDKASPVSIAYRRGKANRILKMHAAEIELADAGSSQGMANLQGFLQTMTAAEE